MKFSSLYNILQKQYVVHIASACNGKQSELQHAHIVAKLIFAAVFMQKFKAQMF